MRMLLAPRILRRSLVCCSAKKPVFGKLRIVDKRTQVKPLTSRLRTSVEQLQNHPTVAKTPFVAPTVYFRRCVVTNLANGRSLTVGLRDGAPPPLAGFAPPESSTPTLDPTLTDPSFAASSTLNGRQLAVIVPYSARENLGEAVDERMVSDTHPFTPSVSAHDAAAAAAGGPVAAARVHTQPQLLVAGPFCVTLEPFDAPPIRVDGVNVGFSFGEGVGGGADALRENDAAAGLNSRDELSGEGGVASPSPPLRRRRLCSVDEGGGGGGGGGFTAVAPVVTGHSHAPPHSPGGGDTAAERVSISCSPASSSSPSFPPSSPHSNPSHRFVTPTCLAHTLASRPPRPLVRVSSTLLSAGGLVVDPRTGAVMTTKRPPRHDARAAAAHHTFVDRSGARWEGVEKGLGTIPATEGAAADVYGVGGMRADSSALSRRQVRAISGGDVGFGIDVSHRFGNEGLRLQSSSMMSYAAQHIYKNSRGHSDVLGPQPSAQGYRRRKVGDSTHSKMGTWRMGGGELERGGSQRSGGVAAWDVSDM